MLARKMKNKRERARKHTLKITCELFLQYTYQKAYIRKYETIFHKVYKFYTSLSIKV